MKTITVCIPPRDDDPEGEPAWFACDVENRRVVEARRVEAPRARGARWHGKSIGKRLWRHSTSMTTS